MRYLVFIAIAAAALLAGAVLFLGRDERPVRTSLAVAEALSADTAGYARAADPRPFRFPDDHGPHPDFRTEWWYYTGNLSTAEGRRFGYQLTIFRTALRPPAGGVTTGHTDAAGDRSEGDVVRSEGDGSDSTWSTRQLYMAHFAVVDERAGVHVGFERFSRGAAGLAGARARPFRVWLEDWSVSGQTADSVRLRAAGEGADEEGDGERGADEAAVDLSLVRLKPIVLQGDDGLDRKGAEPGNASYYYSMTRMRTSGTLRVGGESYEVGGLSWLDREWSTSALGEDQVGWDWFSLQLDDGRDVMFYRLRLRDGGTSPFSNGVVVGADGSVRRLSTRDVEVEPLRYWDSPASGARYPVAWSFRIPDASIDLDLTPLVDGQEMTHSVTYWEGAVRAAGSHAGSGFVEMTGYAEEDAGTR